jgi:hypothetical protein
MKKIIALIFPLVSVTALAQSNAAENTTARPAITDIGKPAGDKTEIQIGKEGGGFTSSDGKLRLVIPEGAVSKKTTFSIRPAVNLGPNGNGKVYQLEPSGIQFKTPLQLTFYYSKEELKGDMQLLLGIAMQNDKGEWFRLNKFVLDTLAKTISSSIKHFSSYSIFEELKIDPASARVKVNKSLCLNIKIINPFRPPPGAPGAGDDELAPLTPSINNSSEQTTSNTTMWRVNDIINGNSSVGQITNVIQNLSATYTAPASIPEKNPVAVEVKLTDETFTQKGVSFNDLRLLSNITVYDDAYEVKMEAVIMGGSPEAWGGLVAYIDEGSFTVSLERNNPAVINIKNHLERLRYSTCPDRVITNPNSCTGIFHVAGAGQIKVTPPNPPGQPYPVVEIWFIQYPTELTRFTFNCPPPPTARERSKGKVDLPTAAQGMPPPLLMFFGMPALPPYIKFIAKDEEQVILESPRGAEGIYYKVWVKKIRED